jgi:hypothetical protein
MSKSGRKILNFWIGDDKCQKIVIKKSTNGQHSKKHTAAADRNKPAPAKARAGSPVGEKGFFRLFARLLLLRKGRWFSHG